jgi:hypothetical protein
MRRDLVPRAARVGLALRVEERATRLEKGRRSRALFPLDSRKDGDSEARAASFDALPRSEISLSLLFSSLSRSPALVPTTSS